MRNLILLFLPLLLYAQILHEGDSVVVKKLNSQHEKEYLLLESGIWFVSWDKESTRVLNKYFEGSSMPENVNMIVDVSQAPSGILSLFILPRMRSYKHPILLSYDEAYNLTLPYKEEHITVLYIKDKRVIEVKFIQNREELKKLLE